MTTLGEILGASKDGDEEEEAPESGEESADKEAEEAGQDLKDALDSGDAVEIFKAFEHCHNVAHARMDEGDDGGGAKPAGILALIKGKKKE